MNSLAVGGEPGPGFLGVCGFWASKPAADGDRGAAPAMGHLGTVCGGASRC